PGRSARRAAARIRPHHQQDHRCGLGPQDSRAPSRLRQGGDRMIGRRALVAGAAALVASPFHARAQTPGRTYRLAVWHLAEPSTNMIENGPSPRFRAFFQELRRSGFVEGLNLIVERYATLGNTERYEPTARRIVDSRPDVIVPNGGVG